MIIYTIQCNCWSKKLHLSFENVTCCHFVYTWLNRPCCTTCIIHGQKRQMATSQWHSMTCRWWLSPILIRQKCRCHGINEREWMRYVTYARLTHGIDSGVPWLNGHNSVVRNDPFIKGWREAMEIDTHKLVHTTCGGALGLHVSYCSSETHWRSWGCSVICLFTFFFPANGMSVALISHSRHSCQVDISNETFQCSILLVLVPLGRHASSATQTRGHIVNCQ